MNEMYTEFLSGLPGELREQVEAAGTQDEALAILREHEIPLPDEALEAVSGGMVWEMKTSI